MLSQSTLSLSSAMEVDPVFVTLGRWKVHFFDRRPAITLIL